VAISSGGSGAGAFTADAEVNGGSTDTVTDHIDTSGVQNPAPEAVYQSERWGEFTYHLGGFTANGTYTVRLHFAETYFKSPGQRIFNVFINGQQVLTNFDIVAAVGAPDKAIVQTFTTTADGSGMITIEYHNGSQNNAKSSGIEVFPAG
nr:coagulation factor 5/8 type domain-containing protein [Ktedonobacterales bacterium]